MTAEIPKRRERCLRVVHLFPDLLSTYGDTGNIRTLVVRAERRGIRVHVARVFGDSPAIPGADLFVIGGGQDRDQLAVEAALGRLSDELIRQLGDGAALLAVCGGYQNLGRSYRFADGRTVRGPGVFPIRTEASAERLVGPVVARLAPGLATCGTGAADAARTTVVGFENHSGRTNLDVIENAFATVEIGHGNNDRDLTEGSLTIAGDGGLRGLRIGSYLHGPLLPRNPHVADVLIRAGLAHAGQPTELEPLDDTDEWRAHDRFIARTRHRTWVDRLPEGVRRVIAPIRNPIGF